MKFLCSLVITQFLTIMMIKLVTSDPGEGLNLFDFLMSSSGKHSHNISFSPDDGKKYRRSFEQKYGHKGKDLIESLGHGSSNFQVTTVLPIHNVTRVVKIKKKKIPASN